MAIVSPYNQYYLSILHELIVYYYVFQGVTGNMGNIYRKLWEYFNQQEARIIMVGLDGAGKTTILYHFKLGEVITTIPTIGMSCTVRY